LDRFDCIIVGGGVAGLSAALTLARAGATFLLVERGEFCGAKNVSGGVLWGRDLARLVPDYWNDDQAGFERFVRHRRLTFMDGDAAFSLDFKSEGFGEPPYMGVTVLRSKFDNWLAGHVEEAIAEQGTDSFIATGVLVDELLREGGRVTGIRAGEETFEADCVILAEGVNNLLTRQVGLQNAFVPPDYVAVGVKEVIRFDRTVLQDRFQLDERSGMSNEFVGYASGGLEGGGFLYTNRESVSVGLVLALTDLRDKQRTPYDVLAEFKAHPVLRDMLRGGETIEYSGHVVGTGDMRLMPREVYMDGLMVAGEAAGLILNNGKAIRGMDFAVRSGIMAAETALQAKDRKDFTAAGLSRYRKDLDETIIRDIRDGQAAVHLLHGPDMFHTVPAIACDFGREFFAISDKPPKKAAAIVSESIRRHSSYWDMARLGWKAWRGL
jgi:electron transfer flavoprotein-quinone oxidoreductase